MHIESIYSVYFQKSKVFLYPLLGIKRGTSVIPKETYISWKNILPEDAKLICVYQIRKDSDYINFTNTVLLKHNRLSNSITVNDSECVFIFDFNDLKSDWGKFIAGKYSQISDKTKNKILNFFQKHSGNYTYVNGYLNPKIHFKYYAEILNVDIDLIKSVGELCDIPDLIKETLILDPVNLNILDSNLITL